MVEAQQQQQKPLDPEVIFDAFRLSGEAAHASAQQGETPIE